MINSQWPLRFLRCMDLRLSIALCLILAVISTLSIYPFIATADGLARIASAVSSEEGFTVLPPMQSYFMKASIWLVGGVGLYTLLQVFTFYAATVIAYKALLKDLPPAVSFFASILTILTPLFLVFPTILTDSAIVFTCIAVIGAMISSIEPMKINKTACFVVLTFTLCVLFGMRLNAIAVAPVVIVLVYFFARSFKWHALAAVIFSTGLITHINSDLRDSSRPEALGMAWEIVAVAKNNPNDEWLKHSLDFCGSTEGAIEKYSDRYLNAIFWDGAPPLPVTCITSVVSSSMVKAVYFSMIKSRPLDWAAVKLSIWGRVYGLTAPLENIRRGIHDVDAKTIEWGGRNTTQQASMREYFFNGADTLGALAYRPFVSVLLSMLCFVFIFDKKVFPRFFCAWAMANAYYAGFLISAQSMEFRYFAPTFYVNFIIIVSLLAYGAATIFKKIHTNKIEKTDNKI